MTFDNPLDPVYKAFLVASDCFGLGERIIEIQHEELICSTQFHGVSTDETYAALEGAEEQVADLAILALFATFERFVIEHLQTANQLLATGYPYRYSARLAQKFRSEVEYWKFDEVLNLFKGEVDADLIGQVKQIKQYRDWIAHQNPNKATPGRFTPERAFDVLRMTVEQIRLTHTPPMVMDAIDTAEYV
ncbi:hypothetical protein [Paraburkholderia sp. 2C]